MPYGTNEVDAEKDAERIQTTEIYAMWRPVVYATIVAVPLTVCGAALCVQGMYYLRVQARADAWVECVRLITEAVVTLLGGSS